jgi:ribosomal protein S20
LEKVIGMVVAGKKLMAGVVAAALLVGGGAIGLTHTEAADAAKDAKEASGKTRGPGTKGQIMAHRGFDIVSQSAKLFGMEPKALFEELKAGKKLTDIASEQAGLSEEDYVQKLVDTQAANIDKAVSDGKLKQETADQHKAGLAERTQKLVENFSIKPGTGGQPRMRGGQGAQGEQGDGHQGGQRRGSQDGQGGQWRGPQGGQGHGPKQEGQGFKSPGMPGFGGFAPMAGEQAIEKLLGMTKEELGAELKAGKSISEVAAGKGISEEQLITAIKDSMTESIKKAVQMKRTPGQDKGKGMKKPADQQAPAQPAN